MAEIIPFRGIRYNKEIVSLDDVTSPPYDVISPADRICYHEKHPKNMVRLILGLEIPEDSDWDNRFTRSAAYLQEWLAEGTLVQDDKPAIYVYEQQFTHKGQPMTLRGFTALVKLHDYADKVVLPHENTLARPKSDLAKLIRETKANFDSVYVLYPDPEHIVDNLLNRICQSQPDGEVTDRDHVRHRLWILPEGPDTELIRNTLADRQIVIADGHHRYETALAYRDEMRQQEGYPQEERPYDYAMMTLVNAYSPGVIVLPTHRMLRNLPSDQIKHLRDELQPMFDLIPTSKDTMISDMEAYEGKAIGIYIPEQAYLAVPGDGIDFELDVITLHQVILDKILGINSERLRQESNLTYTRDEQEAFDAVDSGECQAAFLLNPIKLETMLDITRRGEKMPQKSTYFYPKLLSGLVMRRMKW